MVEILNIWDIIIKISNELTSESTVFCIKKNVWKTYVSSNSGIILKSHIINNMTTIIIITSS